MTDEMLWRDLGIYEAGRADGRRIDSLFGHSDTPFWIDVYTTTICWLKTVLLLSRTEDASRRMVAELAADAGRLGVLVEEVRSAAASDVERRAADRLQTWFNTGWLGLAKPLRQAVGHHVALIG